MIKDIPKISVLVITYNQEDVISRAIESLLSQKDYIYEICVSDDCSKDRTWEILQEYGKKYPDLFVLNRNEPNIGIFENIEKTWTMPSGDVIYQLAGDDECGAGWFKTVVDYILKNQINYQNELFCIYGDYKRKYPNGDEFTSKNVLANKSDMCLKLALRGIIGNRSTCYSINILKKFIRVSQGRSHIAEDAQDRQLQIFSKYNYYIPHVGNIYYSYIGVSTQIDEKILEERLKIRPYLFKLFDEWGVQTDQKDRLYSLEYFPVLSLVLLNYKLKDIVKLLFLSVKCFDFNIGFDFNSVKHMCFAIIRRLPHSRPILW